MGCLNKVDQFTPHFSHGIAVTAPRGGRDRRSPVAGITAPVAPPLAVHRMAMREPRRSSPREEPLSFSLEGGRRKSLPILVRNGKENFEKSIKNL